MRQNPDGGEKRRRQRAAASHHYEVALGAPILLRGPRSFLPSFFPSLDGLQTNNSPLYAELERKEKRAPPDL